MNYNVNEIWIGNQARMIKDNNTTVLSVEEEKRAFLVDNEGYQLIGSNDSLKDRNYLDGGRFVTNIAHITEFKECENDSTINDDELQETLDRINSHKVFSL